MASRRAEAYAKHFKKNNIQPTILTNRWEFNEKDEHVFHNHDDEVIYDKFEGCNVIRLPLLKEKKQRVVFFSKVNIILDWFSGFLDSNNGLRINYSFYRAQLFKTLEKESFDLCIGIFSPHYHLKLCYEVKRRFNIPYVLDFRDLWDNKLMSNTYLKQGLSARLQNKFIRYHWQKWCKNALFISSSSETMAKYLSDYNDLSYPILNGYEPNLFLNEDVDLEPKFTISSIGRIYSFQDLELTFKIIKDIIGFQ